MIFGDSLRAAASNEPAQWIGESIGGTPGTVGTLIPSRYESLLRLRSPDPTADDSWWALYRELFDLVASVGARHTTRPTHAWFAFWEGHGYTSWSTHTAYRNPPTDDAERQQRAARSERRREADRERHVAIAQALAAIPRFDLPNRAYYLTHGALSAITELRSPDTDEWRNPDLFWPDDRAWFAATDVDFWSVYVGGSEAFTIELAAHASSPCEFVDNDDQLPDED